jgi:hypothetical protein
MKSTLKTKGKKLPKPEAGEMGKVDKAPSTAKGKRPSGHLADGVHQSGDAIDGQGAVEMKVTSEMASMTPKTTPTDKSKGDSMELPKGDSEGRHC